MKEATQTQADIGVVSRQEMLHSALENGRERLRTVTQELFPSSHILLPQINQVYELDLAYGEYKALSDAELVQRGAYFRSVRSTLTHHFRICTNTPEQVNASARQERKNFFAANLFAVGYATHGLFPYRGKFHPQMIKAIMNMMGLKPGDVVLDPMAGCGTTAIEASLIGIDSISCELNPFGCLMTQAKVDALDIDCDFFPRLLVKADEIYEKLLAHTERPALLPPPWYSRASSTATIELGRPLDRLPDRVQLLLLLCYFDSVGYASRRKGKSPKDLFPALLSRYLAAVSAFSQTREELDLKLGRAEVMEGDARDLELPNQSVDGVLFSPPYSFAIDYVENDRPQLEMLGVDLSCLKANMVGLVGCGRTAEERVASRVSNYFLDMEKIMQHCERVLRPGGYCVIVVGSNTNQTGGVSLEDGLIEIGGTIGIPLEFQVLREIEGIRNTMREESILFFRKAASATGAGCQA